MADKKNNKEILLEEANFQNNRAGQYAMEERINFYDLIDFQKDEYRDYLKSNCKDKRACCINPNFFTKGNERLKGM